MPLCACECGQEVPEGRTWARGHNSRAQTNLPHSKPKAGPVLLGRCDGCGGPYHLSRRDDGFCHDLCARWDERFRALEARIDRVLEESPQGEGVQIDREGRVVRLTHEDGREWELRDSGIGSVER